jgi:hypothetical protein
MKLVRSICHIRLLHPYCLISISWFYQKTSLDFASKYHVSYSALVSYGSDYPSTLETSLFTDTECIQILATLALSLEVRMHHDPRKILNRVRDRPMEVDIRLEFNPQVHVGHILCLDPNLGDPCQIGILLISMTLKYKLVTVYYLKYPTSNEQHTELPRTRRKTEKRLQIWSVYKVRMTRLKAEYAQSLIR